MDKANVPPTIEVSDSEAEIQSQDDWLRSLGHIIASAHLRKLRSDAKQKASVKTKRRQDAK